ncbi:MAG TPA: 2-isopropylmalate synthase [Xanthomonadaceae bacterium]|nr:2-isopropylmalate synthase [Xanthomonadaceae bacterium]
MTDQVRIFDTTLRDGEQSPGCSMTAAQKRVLAHSLAELGVDVIEAGFPAASPDDFASVAAIAREVRGAGVAALARCQSGDIERASAALEGAEAPRIHVFIATSDIHLEHKLRMSRAQVLDAVANGVALARSHCTDVEFSAEDASRSDPAFLAEAFSAAIDAGASTLNVPDTVGYAVPDEYGALFAYLRKHVRGIERAVLSSHCHDDLGLAVANSLAAVAHGARQVECTINGIGERAGNAALEEIVMALRTRAAHFGLATRIRSERLAPTSRQLVAITGNPVARHKAIVGDNAFAHESGIHQHGMLRHRETYEIMRPEDVGVERSQLVLGKHSGRAALAERLAQLGFQLEEAALNQVFAAFKTLADRKKEVFDADLEALALGQAAGEAGPWRLTALQLQSAIGRDGLPSACVRMQHEDGRCVQEAAVGDGPVHAVFAALERASGTPVTLRQYHVRSLTTGEDAQGEARVEAEVDGREYRGRAVSTDIIEASALALIEVINRIERRRDSVAPLPPGEGLGKGCDRSEAHQHTRSLTPSPSPDGRGEQAA